MALVLITLQDNADGDTVINVQSEPFIDLHQQPADDAPQSIKAAWIALSAVTSAHAEPAPDQ